MALITSLDALAFIGESTPTSAQLVAMDVIRPLAEDAVKQYVGYSIEQATHTHYLPEDSTYQGELVGYDVINNRVYEEYSCGPRFLYVPERPLRSITSIFEDPSAEGGQASGDFGVSTELTAGLDFYIDYTVAGVSWSGRLERIVTNWSTKRRTVKVTYVAGLTAGELAGTTAIRGPEGGGVSAIRYAAMMAASMYYNEAQSLNDGGQGPIKSERLYDYAVTYADDMVKLMSMQYKLPPKAMLLLDPFRRYAW